MISGNFKPDTLAYKLYRDEIKKHSEQLNKYVAGLIDSDGSIILRRDHGYLGLRVTITSIDAQLLVALRIHYKLGSTYFKEDYKVCVWELSKKDSLILLGRLKKHLLIKGKLAEFSIYITKEISKINQTQWLELKSCFSKLRRDTRWIKHPKHPAWAWLAGFLDGDGYYRFYQRKRFHKGRGTTYFNNTLEVGCLQHQSKKYLLDFLVLHLGGRVHIRKKDGHPAWIRALGKGHSSFSVDFLRKMRKYSCIPRKYAKIESMLEFHNTTRRD